MKVISLDLRIFDADKKGIHQIMTNLEVPNDTNYRKNVELFSRPQLLKLVHNLCSWFNPSNSLLRYVDEDGDEIVLDDLDSYVEAVKLAERVCTLSLVIARNESNLVACGDTNEEVPVWLGPILEKMKAQVKEEVLDSLNKQQTPPVQHSVVGQADCKAKKENSNNGNKKPKCRTRSKSNEYNYADDALMCKNCREQVKEPYFFCLEKKCTTIVCHLCVGGHPVDHVMLRLPEKLQSGRRKLVEMASLVIFSRPRDHKRQETDNKTEKAKKKGKEEQKDNFPIVVSLAPFGPPDFSCEVLSTEVHFSSENDINVCWNVKNPGIDWLPGVKMECLTISDPILNLPHMESSKIIDPPLKSNEICDLMVQFRVEGGERMAPGKTYFTQWILTYHGYRFYTLSADIKGETSIQTEFSTDTERLQESVGVDVSLDEIFSRSEELKQKSLDRSFTHVTEDDLLSQYSCVSSDSSTHDFEVVVRNPFSTDAENPFKKDDDDSYVLATPLNTTDEVDEDDFDLEFINRSNKSQDQTDFLNQLTTSLSNLMATSATEVEKSRRPNVDDETQPLLVDLDEIVDAKSYDGCKTLAAPPGVVDPNSLSIFEDAVADASAIVVQQTEMETFFLANEPTSVATVTGEESVSMATTIDAEEEERRELDELARSVQNYQFQSPVTQTATNEISPPQQDTLVKTVVDSNVLLPSDDGNIVTMATAIGQSAPVTNVSRDDSIATTINSVIHRVSSQALSTVSNVLQAVSMATSSVGSTVNRSTSTAVINESTQNKWQPPHPTWQPVMLPVTTATAPQWQPVVLPVTPTSTTTWQPPVAWVPKATQTQNTWLPPPGWTPPNTSWEKWSTTFDAKMKILKDMGFGDEYKNYTLLVEHGGQMELVVSALLSEIPLD